MNKVIDGAIAALREKLGGERFDGSVKFVIEQEGSIRIDDSGVTEDYRDADCVITATRETFEGMLDGGINPTAAFMTGKLRIDGDIGLAMRLGSFLA